MPRSDAARIPRAAGLSRRLLAGLGIAAALALAVVAWSSSRLGEYSVLTMGVDAAHVGHGARGAGVSVTALTADPSAPADVRYTLVARSGSIQLPGGRTVEGYTLNGSSPGPTVHARQGDLVEVTLVNESVAGGTTLHWHGMDVPNAADGVAGVTQDAVPVGGRYVYRFRADDAGTYWYHAHQLSHEQVERGLLGAVVIEPASSPTRVATASPPAKDAIALLHVYEGQHTLNGRVEDEHVVAEPGERVRIRVINTDQGTAAVWASQEFRVVAVDGREVNEPTEVIGRRVLVPAGGRVDVEVVAPGAGSGAEAAAGAARVHVGGARSVVVGPAGAEPPKVRQPQQDLDLLSYGSPLPLGFDSGRPDRTYDYVIGRRPGLIDGRPGIYWTINGRMFPDVPMFHVTKGDVVRMRISNESDEVHPMHLHGHHIVVLSRNDIAAQGSPWWVDSLDVHPGERYEVAFVADNPGIWTDHCHTLPHAVEGLVAHVMYDGVTTPFTINGVAGNQPE